MKAVKWIIRLFRVCREPDFDENALYYIGGADVLPPPLEPVREEEMIRLLQTEQAAEAKRTLIEHNLRLVVYIARRFDNTGVGVEDLISIGTIGLLKAVNTYKADKNIKLATYASRCIENEILMYLRRTSKNKAEVSIDEPLNTDFDGNELLLGDILGTEEDVISRDLEREAEHTLLRRSIDRLSQREKIIVCLRFGLNPEPGREENEAVYPVEEGKEMTQKEVAALLGISQSYISRLEKKIMLRLRKEMLKES